MGLLVISCEARSRLILAAWMIIPFAVAALVLQRPMSTRYLHQCLLAVVAAALMVTALERLMVGTSPGKSVGCRRRSEWFSFSALLLRPERRAGHLKTESPRRASEKRGWCWRPAVRAHSGPHVHS
jgi:hypothetical protein